MKIVLFGGTSEGRKLSHALASHGHEVIVCVATDYGMEEEGSAEGLQVQAGRKNVEEMTALLKTAELCIDATHPYAVDATKNILTASKAAQTTCIRFLRPASELSEEQDTDVIFVDSAAEAAAFLSGKEGNVLLTTGVKDLPCYKELEKERLFPRVLPLHTSLDMCENVGIPHRNILAMQGPFCQSLNEALMEQHHIAFLVTKNSGSAGGFKEKLDSCRNKGVSMVMIGRPEAIEEELADQVLGTMEEVLAYCDQAGKGIQEEKA